MFIAEQVQRGASSTIEGAGWLQHCCEGNTITHQGTKTKKEGKRNSARIKEIAISPPPLVLFRCDAFDRKHFLNTTGLLFKRFPHKIMALLRVDGGHRVH